jgi:hypothetical protein
MSKPREIKYCSDLPIKFSCCQSCHEEFNEGYSYPFVGEYKGEEYSLCCTGINALDESVKDKNKAMQSEGE